MKTVHYPINGELDLHTFHPKDVKDLVPEYIQACRDEGIYQIRIIHGKGKGVLRKMIHSILDSDSDVDNYWQEGNTGSWGATIVKLKE